LSREQWKFRQKVRKPLRHDWGFTQWQDRYAALCREAFDVGPDAVGMMTDTLYDLIASDRVFPIAAREVQRTSGPTLGPDDKEPITGLDHHARCNRFRHLQKWLRDRVYQPGKTRKVCIPKFPTGKRTIQIANFDDRVVAKAAQIILDPLIDPTLHVCCFGYRPGSSRFHALARLDRYLTEGYRYAVIVDIRKAFDRIPHGQLRETLRSRVPNEQFTNLVEALLGMGQSIGIPQGNALSPLMLNLYCDSRIDRPWGNKYASWPMIRYADDILILTRRRSMALQSLSALKRLVQSASLQLKDASEERVFDLRDYDGVNWLGNRIATDEWGVVTMLRSDESDRLAFKLRNQKKQDETDADIGRRLKQWARERGPAYGWGQRGHLIRIVREASKAAGVTPDVPQYSLLKCWQKGNERWLSIRNAETQFAKNKDSNAITTSNQSQF
jgi:hypothetical protein